MTSFGRPSAGLLSIALLLAVSSAPSATADGPVRVTAIDPDGRPVPGALVIEAPQEPDGRFRIDPTSPALGRLDERGVLTPLPTLSDPASRWAVVSPGRVPALVPDTVEGASVRLDPATTVTGTLLDERGRPAADVGLRAVVSEGEVGRDEPSPYRHLSFRVVPDAEGAFALDAPRDVALRWFVVRRDGRWEPAPAFEPGGTLTVVRGSALVGRVLDAEGAVPVSALAVSLRPVTVELHRENARAIEPDAGGGAAVPGAGGAIEDRASISAASDESGRLRYFDVPPGVYEATLSDPRFAFDGDPPRVDVSGTAPRRVETWWIRRRAGVVGRVVDGRTRFPIEGATIVLAPPAGAVAARVPHALGGPAISGPDGRFRLEGILPGRGYRLAVSAPDRAPIVETIDLVSGQVADRADFLLLAARTLRISCADEEGRVIAGVEVRVTPGSRPEPDPADPISAAFVRVAITDGAGVAVVTGVGEGPSLVRARRTGYVEGRATVADPGPGGSLAERVGLAHRAAISGIVRFSDKPVEGIRIRGRGRSSGEQRETAPDADGHFLLDDWSSEPVDVEAISTRSPSGASRGVVLARRESVVAGASELVVLDVPPLRRISGDVDGLAAPPAGARVRLETERFDPAFDDVRWRIVEEQPLSVVGAHATFEFLAIPPGRFAVRAIEGTRNTGPIDVTVEAGDVDGVLLLVPAPARVSGRVVDGLRFQAALGALVRLERLEGEAAVSESADAMPSAITRDDGVFAFDDVAPGTYRVEARDPSDVDVAASASAEVSLRAGETVFVPLRLSAGGWIEGRVTDAAVRPLASVPLRVVRLPAEVPVDRTRTAEDGRFRTRPLPAGRYRLFVDAGRGLASGLEADVEVSAGDASEVDFSSHGDGVIEGVVRRRGTPVPGLHVEATSAAGARGADRIVLRAIADAFGQFRFPGLTEGSYRLAIIDGAVRSLGLVELRAGDRVARDIEVGEGRIAGTVRTAKGDAVREADVLAVPEPGQRLDVEGRVRTSSDGTFVIAGLPVGRYRLLVTPAGRPTRLVGGVFADVSGQERPIEIVIGRGARLELTVKDDRRRPVASAEVWIEDAKGVTLHPRAFRTGPGGRVIVDSLPEGRCQLRVRASGYGRPTPTAVDLRDGNVSSAEIIVRPAGAIALTVRAGFDPCARARVDLYRMPGRIAVEARRTLRRPDECGCVGYTTRTGTLRLDELEEGNYLIVVGAGRGLEEWSLPVYVRAGEAEPVDALLRPGRR